MKIKCFKQQCVFNLTAASYLEKVIANSKVLTVAER